MKEITSEPIRIVFDAVSTPETEDAGYDLLGPGGAIVILRFMSIPENKQTPDKLIADISADPFKADRRQLAADLYKQIPALIASGDITVCMHMKASKVCCTLICLLCSLSASKWFQAVLRVFPPVWSR